MLVADQRFKSGDPGSIRRDLGLIKQLELRRADGSDPCHTRLSMDRGGLAGLDIKHLCVILSCKACSGFSGTQFHCAQPYQQLLKEV